ncbi:MAG: molybdate ABC transporter permease subunit [Deltaproteobacteria bacterium]|nr:molybdate ABC transporter permease subunit [Deltaproteobacteria bacterium]
MVDPVAAIRLSLIVGLLATCLGFPVAVAAGWLLARRHFIGKTALSTLLLAPLVLPPVVTGFLLLEAFGARGPLGALDVPFTLSAAVLAAFTVGLPLYIMAARNAFEAVDPHYEEVSVSLGVSPWATFRRITLPLALPGILAGAVLTFARALGEFGATTVLAGNIEGETRTMALAVYTLLEMPEGDEGITFLAWVSIAIAFVALAGYELTVRWQRRRLETRR